MKDVCLLAAFALAASVAQTAHAQITEATSPTNASATRKSDASADAQARRARNSNQPGPFGVGADVGVNPGGIEPGVLYDFNKSLTLRGMVDLGSGYSAITGQLLYRFVLRDQPQRVTLTPYVGGGPILVIVDYGGPVGSHGFTGLLASGGLFITVKTIPHWRFSGDLNAPLYRYSGFPQPVLHGLYLGAGAHYFF
jgi:hypothetical protein